MLPQRRPRVEQAVQVLGRGELLELAIELRGDEDRPAEVGVGAADGGGRAELPVGGVLQAQAQPRRARLQRVEEDLLRLDRGARGHGVLRHRHVGRHREQAGRIDEDDVGRELPADTEVNRHRTTSFDCASRAFCLDERGHRKCAAALLTRQGRAEEDGRLVARGSCWQWTWMGRRVIELVPTGTSGS